MEEPIWIDDFYLYVTEFLSDELSVFEMTPDERVTRRAHFPLAQIETRLPAVMGELLHRGFTQAELARVMTRLKEEGEL